jgi:hypothetical protein
VTRLPPDLDALGAQLEEAAGRQLERAHRRRRRLDALCVLVLGVPLAVAAATTDVAPASTPVSVAARLNPSQMILSGGLAVPPQALIASNGRLCTRDPDCRTPDHPSPVPFPFRSL